MSKILAVFGATGQQGGSVVDHVLNDPELSKEYTIRAITRDPSSASGQKLLAKKVEVVRADVNDPASLKSVFEGVHTVFALTAPEYGADTKAIELRQGKDMADAAMAQGVQMFIFSTLPHIERISGGKYTTVGGFDGKAEAEGYMRTLPMKTAFFSPGSFMQNFNGIMTPKPDYSKNGEYVIARPTNPQTQLPLIDTAGDTGKYVGAILADPAKYEGKTFCAASALYTMTEIAEILSKTTGKTVKYQQIPVETFASYLPPSAGYLVEMMLFQQDFGYYGPNTKDMVAWAAQNARGKVHSFEEYLAKNPVKLE